MFAYGFYDILKILIIINKIINYFREDIKAFVGSQKNNVTKQDRSQRWNQSENVPEDLETADVVSLWLRLGILQERLSGEFVQ